MNNFPASTKMRSIISIAPPRQWYGFLSRHPDQDASPAITSLNDEKWRAMVRINRTVNASAYITDGPNDLWRYPQNGGGDCEDLALEKRRRLTEAGLDCGALRITLCLYNGAGHAVLCVCTDHGDYILDNICPWVTTWGRLPYHWVTRWNGPRWAMISNF